MCCFWGHRRHFCVGGQFVAELGLRRQILFLAGQDLRASAARAAKDRANRRAFAAAEQCAQYRANGRAAAHVDAGALVAPSPPGVPLPEPAACIR